MKRLFASLMLVAALAAQAQAANLLTNGAFEPSGGQVPFWTLQEYVTGSPATVLNTAELMPWGSGGTKILWLRPFAGGSAPGPNNLTSAVLTQTVTGVPGETYTFSGDSRWETNYSGGVTTLDAGSPLGAVASPTSTTMELAFLDSGGAVLGSPVTLDLRTEQFNINFTTTHNLVGVAPTGTAQVRVTARADSMVYNLDPSQSAFYEEFSLKRSSDPGTEVLLNAGLEDGAATGLEGWTLVSNDPENPANDEVIRAIGFANHTTGGTTGMWLSSFFGEPATPVDGKVTQTVPGVVGGNYSFSGWSKFEANYSAASTFLSIEFLDGSDAVIGSPATLDLATAGQLFDATWREFTVNGTAPAGTVNVRVSAGMEDGITTTGAQSAFFDDLALSLGSAGQPGDFDDDGDVDGSDFLVWQRTDGTPAGLALWNANYPFNPPLVAATSAVPEPASLSLMLGLALLGLRRR